MKNLHEAIVLFVSIYFLELIYAVITAWPAAIVASMLKGKENLDVFDFNTSYNPFQR